MSTRIGIQYHGFMKKWHLIFVWLILILSCDHKKNLSGSADEITDVRDFIGLFAPISLPCQFSDTILVHHAKDSLIRYKTMLHFIPDTVFTNHFGKGASPKIYSLGKVKVAKEETYLLIKATTATRKMMYILCFDKMDKFTASEPLMNVTSDAPASWIAAIDNKYTISSTKQHKSSDGQLLYRKWVYIYNDAGIFTLILTESNESNAKNLEIVNPIESLPRKHKFSGDYLQDKRNFISFRDASNNSYIQFFVHFEKDNGDCKGELKGRARFTSSTTAQYRSNGDPCMIDFSFGDNSVRMRELEGCGNHRDIKCFFDGFYTRHKEAKSKQTKKNSK
ncbi:MAG TPA: hypothetical protein VMH01_15440 [Puia sp.]|nr:hypothetical protein [Puia sp.]